MAVFACKRKLIKSRLADGLKILLFYLALNRPNFDRKKNKTFSIKILIIFRILSICFRDRVFEFLELEQ